MTYLTSKDVMNRYAISRMTLYNWRHNDSMKFPRPVNFNGNLRWKRDDLEQWEQNFDYAEA